MGLFALLFYGAILVGIVLVIRAAVQALRSLGRTAASMESIQKTLGELKTSVEALERQHKSEEAVTDENRR